MSKHRITERVNKPTKGTDDAWYNSEWVRAPLELAILAAMFYLAYIVFYYWVKG